MASTKSSKCIIFIYVSFWQTICTEQVCVNYIAQKPLDGYHCPVDGRTIKLSQVTSNMCSHYCVTLSQCHIVSYDANRHLCLVHDSLCIEMVRDKEQVFSSVMFYMSPRRGCISWLPYQGNTPEGERLVCRHSSKRRYIAIRLHYNNEILPGRFADHSTLLKLVSHVNGLTGIETSPTSSMDYLVVSEECSIAWVPYKAGDQMPPRAVVGGRKSHGGPLFVVSLWLSRGSYKPIYAYGHYDPDSQLGYGFNSGPDSSSSVNVMVEIWNIYHNRKGLLNFLAHLDNLKQQ